jgi:hypothetical protein
MSDIVLVAMITGGVALSNGVVLAILNRRWKRKDQRNDEISLLKDEMSFMGDDIKKLFKLLGRIGKGLDIGLKNDKVIFKAFRDNSINGESEAQERVMDEYFTQCTVDGFRTNRED